MFFYAFVVFVAEVFARGLYFGKRGLNFGKTLVEQFALRLYRAHVLVKVGEVAEGLHYLLSVLVRHCLELAYLAGEFGKFGLGCGALSGEFFRSVRIFLTVRFGAADFPFNVVYALRRKGYVLLRGAQFFLYGVCLFLKHLALARLLLQAHGVAQQPFVEFGKVGIRAADRFAALLVLVENLLGTGGEFFYFFGAGVDFIGNLLLALGTGIVLIYV